MFPHSPHDSVTGKMCEGRGKLNIYNLSGGKCTVQHVGYVAKGQARYPVFSLFLLDPPAPCRSEYVGAEVKGVLLAY